jgi:hypothetical protein
MASSNQGAVMRNLRLSELTLAVCLLAVAALAAQPRLLVQMDLTLPGDLAPSVQVRDGEPVQLVVRDSVKLGLVPSVQGDVVVVAVYDLENASERRLEEVEVVVGGVAVSLEAFPGVELSIPRVLEP